MIPPEVHIYQARVHCRTCGVTWNTRNAFDILAIRHVLASHMPHTWMNTHGQPGSHWPGRDAAVLTFALIAAPPVDALVIPG